MSLAKAGTPGPESKVEQSSAEPDGTLHIRQLTMPPSELWSAEYRAFFATYAAAASQPAELPIPSRTAPISDWQKFDAWWNQRYSASLLAQVRRRYPVHVQEAEIAGVRDGIGNSAGCDAAAA
jgi:hypothetical protein